MCSRHTAREQGNRVGIQAPTRSDPPSTSMPTLIRPHMIPGDPGVGQEDAE